MNLMSSGIKAKIKIERPKTCPVADISKNNKAKCRSIKWNNKKETITEEFVSDKKINDQNIEEIFSYNSDRVYRIQRKNENCICTSMEESDTPITNVYANKGDLFISFYAKNIENLKKILKNIDKKEDIKIEFLVESPENNENENKTKFIDLDRLTDRQIEVLNKAYEMGYFEHPKKANAGEIAQELGITPPTLIEHLSAAQTKIINQIKN